MRTLNNKIVRSFFALTACIAMAFGFFACSNGADDNTALLAALLASKQQTQSNGGGQNSNPTPSPATTTPAPTETAPTPAAIYTITFNANDGSENPATVTQNFTAGVPQGLIPVEELGFSKEGFNFAGWGRAPKSTQASYADGASYTANAPATLYALWSEIPVYSVNIPVNENGSVTATPATGSAGTEITLLAAPNAGYEFGAFTVTAEDGTDVPMTDNAFTMPDCNVSVSAAFAKIDYSITILGAENGGVSTENATANYGDTVTLEITPDEGYALATLTYALQDEEPVNIGGIGRQRSFVMPIGNVTVAATFTPIALSVNVADSIEGGTVAATPTNANVGDQITLVPTANVGWRFVSWNVMAEGGSPVTVENNKFTMPAKSVSVSATFEKINYSITVLTSDNGSVTGLPTGATVGTEIALSNTPNAGYKFVSYTVRGADGTAVTVADGKFTMPASDVMVTAVFSLITYKIDVGAVENGSVVARAAAAAEGADVTLNITPASGYALETLIVTAADGSLVSVSGTDNEKSFKMPAQSVTVSASFITIEMFKRSIPLTLEAIEAGAKVNFKNMASGPVTYRINYGNVQTIASNEDGTITLEKAGDKVVFYGNNTSYAQSANNNFSNIGCDKACYVYGNIMSLVSGDAFASSYTLSEPYTFYKLFFKNSYIKNKTDAELLLPATTLTESCYFGMFQGCTSLAVVPVLPATTLTKSCYRYMFSGCTSLAVAPVLPATTLAESCYSYMFWGCTSLAVAPALPATTLAVLCYESMFKNCAGLTSAPDLPATMLAGGCYWGMFDGCASLTSAPALPATTLAWRCYWSMFSGCASLTSAPNLPATTLASWCYRDMFSGCASLASAPDLPVTTLAESCYRGMFWRCTSLAVAPALPATTLAGDCYRDMFSGCASLTVAPELPATTLAESCYGGMFYGCTSLKSAPALLATTLAESCYGGMFDGCASLTVAPELPATTLAKSCYEGMFQGCTRLTSAPELPATTLVESCYRDMFSRCAGLASAPDLPVTTLAESCYRGMFYGCTKLSIVTCLATNISAADCTKDWLRGVASKGTFIKKLGVTIWPEGDSGIPSGWTVNDNNGGSVKVLDNIKNGTVKSDATFYYGGQTVTLTITPESGYKLSSLVVKDEDGKVIETSGTDDSRTFTMPAKNVTVSATFVAIYNVNIGTFANGSVAANVTTVIAGTSVTLTVKPNAGYALKTLAYTPQGGSAISVGGSGNTRTFTMPAQNVTVSATFAAINNVSIGTFANGSVAASPMSAIVGTSVTLTASPAPGYRLDTLTVKDASGATVSTSGTGDTRTFKMPDANVTVKATFVLITYSVNICSSNHGTVTASKTSVAGGKSVTLTVKPDAGYRLDTLIVKDANGSTVSTSGSGNTKTFTMPEKNVTVTVTFVAINYTVSVSSSEHGTVTADKTSGIYGTSVALTINPDSGYKLYVLTVKGTDGSAVSTSGIGDTRTFKIPVADVTVFAVFVPLAAFSTGAYTALPAGVDGSAGASGTYVTYGLYPQTIIDKSVAINYEEKKTIGTFSCYKGSDGEWYSSVYKDGNVSWFKMEPIKWRVLTKNYNGKKLLLAENILTGCDYYDGDTSTHRKVYNKGELTLVYANNYNESRIEAYLNGSWYYDGKKEHTPGGGVTDHRNVEFQGKGFKTEASLDTGYVSDIFLLSSGEVSSSEYGFNSTVRAKVVRTDYAMAKGGASWWWLRTPYTSMPNNDCVKVVEDDGDIGWMSVGYSCGVVPAICVDR